MRVRRFVRSLHRGGSLAVLVSLAFSLLASGCMWGIVTDADTGAPVSGATVSYTDSQGHAATTTTGAGGFYSFDSASGPSPSRGPITLTVNASGYQEFSAPRLVEYNDNDNADISDLSSFWEVQHSALAPASAAPPPALTPEAVLTADLAITDVYPDYLPVGSLYIRITNHGPHSVDGIGVDLSCYLWWWNDTTPLTTSEWINPGVVLHLDPGQTVAVPMNAQVHTDQYKYVAGCDMGVPLGIDPDSSNNGYSENIP